MTNMRPPNKTTLLKVVILGDGGVGKSCLMNRFVSNRYDENNFHTIGVEFMNRDIDVDSEKYTLQIWDTAGQERFRALRTPFYRGSDVCLLCYAIDDFESFRGLKHWHDEFLTYADIKTNNFPFIVVGNKNDMLQHQRQVNKDEVQQWCNGNGVVSFIETSSKTADNVTEAFILAVRQWKQMENIATNEMRRQNNGDTIDLTKTIRMAKNNFCCIGGGGGNGQTNKVDKDNFSNYSGDLDRDESQTTRPASLTLTPQRIFGRANQQRKTENTNFKL